MIKYSLSSLQSEMLEDEAFGLDHTKLGMFQSAVRSERMSTATR